MFPSCWDGKNLDSDDHKSHVAFPDGVSTGNCPSTHPYRFITLFYEVTFNVADMDYSLAKNETQPFVFAQGDPTGYGFQYAHVLFVFGKALAKLNPAAVTSSMAGMSMFFKRPWMTALTTLVSCAFFPLDVLFTLTHALHSEYCEHFNLQDYNHECHKTPTINETVLGTLDKLPGNNPVFDGPGRAPVYPDDTSPQIFEAVGYEGTVPPIGASVLPSSPKTITEYNGYNYTGCFDEPASGVRALKNSLVSKISSGVSVDTCLDACRKVCKGQNLLGFYFNLMASCRLVTIIVVWSTVRSVGGPL